MNYPLANGISNSNLKKSKNKEIILQLYNDGVSLRDIANILNVSHMTIYRTIKK